MTGAPKSMAAWSRRAELRLARIITSSKKVSQLKKLGPAGPWSASVKIVGSAAMKRLNSTYRRKHYATDVLSFAAPEPFRSQGFLGELVICAPILERQARELGHAAERELDVLIAHGLLHLLGLDHERSRAEATRVAALETRVLAGPGLVGRVRR